MRKYREYTDQDIINYAKEVKSISGLLRKLNLVVCGGNYANIKKNLQKLNVNTTHWTGKAWNKGERLKNWTEYTRAVHFKPHLIRERGHQCEQCKRKTWNNLDIPLEVHHIDGDRTNNAKKNLQLLCPNCHAQTKNWRNKKQDKLKS